MSILKKWWFYIIIFAIIAIIVALVLFINTQEDIIEQDERRQINGEDTSNDIIVIMRTPENNNNEEMPEEVLQRRPRSYMEGYLMVGEIEIPRINLRYNILERGTVRSLNIGVAVMWPNDAEEELNEPGNVVIIGHNYRNGTLFSNNARLQLGDTITITDTAGRRVNYVIYEMFETTDTDTRFITRDTRGATEITLSTCTDCGDRRLVIQARAE